MIKPIEPYQLNELAVDPDREIKRAILCNMGRFGLAIGELIRRQNEAIGSAFGDPGDPSTWFDPNDLEGAENGEANQADGDNIFPLAGKSDADLGDEIAQIDRDIANGNFGVPTNLEDTPLSGAEVGDISPDGKFVPDPVGGDDERTRPSDSLPTDDTPSGPLDHPDPDPPLDDSEKEGGDE